MTKPVQSKIPATLQALESLESLVAEALQGSADSPETEATKYNVWLALHELCTNIVRHAYAGHKGWIYISLSDRTSPDHLRITVQDNAMKTFDMARWTPPDLDEPKASGMGIWLIKQLMDEVAHEPQPGRNRWILTKRVAKEPAIT